MSDSPSEETVTETPDDSGESGASTEQERVFLLLIDESEEFEVALRFACGRANNTGGRIALMYVVPPAEFQHWLGVGNLMQQEGRETAEEMCRVVGERVQKRTGKMPIVYIREGKANEELTKLIEEEPQISVLVLGASIAGNGPGPIVTHIVNEMSGNFRVPITIVPGGMTEEEIDHIT